MRLPLRTLASLAAAGALAAAAAGCSQSPVIATVGDRTITVHDFNEQAKALAGRIALPPDSARSLVLDELIQRELLLVAAKGNPALPDTYVTKRRADIEETELARAFIDELAPKQIGVSDAEVLKLWQWRQSASHVQVVFTADERDARAARAALDHGEDFGAVATRFDRTAMLPPNGDLGFVQPGALVNPLDDLARTTPVGKLVGPVQAPGQGWFIIRVLGREPRENGTYAQQETELRGMIEQRKRRATVLSRYTALRDEYRVTPDPEALQALFTRVNRAQFRDSTGAPPPPLTAAERARVICRWDGGAPALRGALTLGEATDLMDSGRAPRIDPMRFDGYPEWAKQVALMKVAVIEARRRHLNEEPAVADRIRQQTEQIALQAVYQTRVVDRAEPTPDEVQRAYQQNVQAFTQLRSLTVQHMALPDSTAAIAAAMRLQQTQVAGAKTLKDAVLLASPNLAVQEETIHFPTTDPMWQQLGPALAQQQPGAVLGPLHMPEGWWILQVVAKDMPVTPFEALTPDQQQGLQQMARQYASQRLLKDLTDSLRTAVPVVVHREVLKRTTWPEPTIEQMLQGMQGAQGMPGAEMPPG